MRTITVNQLHCKQSTYQIRRITTLAKKVHDPLTRKYLADKIVAEHTFGNPTPEVTRAANHALVILEDTRRVK